MNIQQEAIYDTVLLGLAKQKNNNKFSVLQKTMLKNKTLSSSQIEGRSAWLKIQEC